MTRYVALGLIVVLAPGLAVCQANLVINGSLTGAVGFGMQPAPWSTLHPPMIHMPPSTIAPGGLADIGGILAPGIPPSPDGGTFLVFTASAIMSQDYAGQNIAGLVPGRTYTLGFYYTNAGAAFAFGPLELSPGQMQATIAGQTFATEVLTFAGAGEQEWRLATFNFQATQPVEHLGFFTDDALFYGAIDGVFIVPEPSGATLGLIAAIVCLAMSRVSRRFPKWPSR